MVSYRKTTVFFSTCVFFVGISKSMSSLSRDCRCCRHKTEKIHFNKKKLVFVVLEDDEQGRANEHTFPFYMQNKKAAKHLWKCAVEHHTFFRLNGPPKEPGVGNRLFRMNSRFRYSGKTESQTAHEMRPRKTAPQFERRPSQRYSRRNSVRRPPAAPTAGNPEVTSPVTVPRSSSGTAEVLEFKSLRYTSIFFSKIVIICIYLYLSKNSGEI